MGLYVEVMCDERKEGYKPGSFITAICWSNRNDNAQGYSVAQARKEARKQGWIIRGRYSCCPGCATVLPTPSPVE